MGTYNSKTHSITSSKEVHSLNKGVHSLFKECTVCFESKNCILCSKNKHPICNDCIKGHYKAKIEEQNVDLKCISCDGEYDKHKIYKIIDNKKKFKELLEIKQCLKISSKLKNYQICPKCSRGGAIIYSEQRVSLTCPKCKYIWCSECKKNHYGDCGINIRNDIATIIDIVYIKKCPGCGIEYSKEKGCNHVKYHYCGKDSCYRCEKLITTPNPYLHFREGRCITFDDVDMDKIRVDSLIEEYIRKNRRYESEIRKIYKTFTLPDAEIRSEFNFRDWIQNPNPRRNFLPELPRFEVPETRRRERTYDMFIPDDMEYNERFVVLPYRNEQALFLRNGEFIGVIGNNRLLRHVESRNLIIIRETLEEYYMYRRDVFPK